jgi:GNAT superfamily N-acetyltransferase
MPALTFQFAEKESQAALVKMILTFLKQDFDAKTLPQSALLTQPVLFDSLDDDDFNAWKEQHAHYTSNGEPRHHFWHNAEIIANSFKQCNGMVAFDATGALVAYLTWINYGLRTEIDIIEVLPAYRQQGIGRLMFAELSAHYPTARVLTASAVEASRGYFAHIGWKKNKNDGQYYTIIKAGLSPQATLPSGTVIALCAADFYDVCENHEKYASLVQYFKIELNAEGQLIQPIVTPFQYEGYVGIYFDRRLIACGKAKHLFNEAGKIDSANLFVMDAFSPINAELYQGTGFCQTKKPAEQVASLGSLGFYANQPEDRKRAREETPEIRPR